MKKTYLWMLIILLAFSVALVSCTEECKHVDANDDYLCDNCGEDFEDGLTTVPVTFKVRFDDGSIAAGIGFTLKRGEVTYSYTSDSDGNAKADLVAGAYYLDYDYATIPEYCTPDTFGVKIENTTGDVTITITNNTPDGSAKKPFFVSESETEITLGAGEEIHYMIRVLGIRYINVYNSAVSIGYLGDNYTAEDGVASLVISSDSSDVSTAVFSVKNNSDSSITTVLEVNSPLGSYENPIETDGSGVSVTVNSDSIVYYQWTAEADGVLTLVANSDRNNISIRRVIENDVPIDVYTGGQLSTSIEVLCGDVITIGVSALDAGENHENQEYDIEISFTLTFE